MRFSSGENNNIDKASIDEFKKKKTNIYIYNDECATLYELDELPPRNINLEALNCAFTISNTLNLKYFDKIQFMRKMIVDGSCPSGFQRTAILGLGGVIEIENKKKIGINAINLEEDSCRIIEKNQNENIFSLDRLGIPLIEITTDCNLNTSKEVFSCAKKLGMILRSDERIKKGLGTIRQDLNISIKSGSRIEIKGCQDLKNLENIVNIEIMRQMNLIKLKNELNKRKLNKKNFYEKKFFNLTKNFKNTKCNFIKNKLVFGIKFNNFKNILGFELCENIKIGTEIKNKNKVKFSMFNGIIHSDENLEKYEIKKNDLEKILGKNFLILVGDDEKLIKKSLKNLIEILKEFFDNMKPQVRQVINIFNTKYLRDISTSGRMYPETDLKNLKINFDEIKKFKINEFYDDKIKRISKQLNLDENKTKIILEKFEENEINNLLKNSFRDCKKLFEIIYEIPKDIKKRENLKIYNFKFSLLNDLLKLDKKKKFSQKIIRDIFISLYKDKKDECENLEKYLKKKNLIFDEIPQKEIENKIKKLILKNPKAPIGALMGICMKEFCGKVDGKKINEILRKELK